MIKYFLELIYPSVCGFCNEIDRNSLCEKCRLKFKSLEINRVDIYKDKYFDKHIYIFKYENEIRNLLLNYKFNEKIYLYKTISKIITNNEKVCNFIKEYDIIITIPLHKKRFNFRGYNQCDLIINEVNKSIKNLNIRNNIIIKIKNSKPQSTLNRKDRSRNVKNAFKIINSKFIENKKILLFDDIYTTGNTANECAKILMENDAKEVGIFTLAKD